MSTHKFRKFTRFIGVFLLIFILSPGFFKMIISAENIFIKMQIFNLILNEIQKSYIEEVDPIELMEDAIKGMLSNLDPHTTYLPREQYETWHKKFDGFGGIGIYYDIIQGYVTVTSVIEDSPAEAAGLHPNDKIIGINGEKMVGIKDDVISEKIKGEEGTQVVLLVSRDDWKTPREVKLTLRRIFISSVPDAYLLTPEIGYIYLAKFTATTTAELKTAVENLQKMGMQKLILDLRNNGGGLMHAAVDVADLFLPGKRKIVFKKGRSQSSYEAFFSSGNAPFANLPLLILINHATASSSEIVAGAIQDWDRGLIAGETSFGKGLVQNQIPLKDGSALRLTTAKYYTPSGRLIQRPFDNGIADYYEQGYDDVDPNAIADSTENKPVFFTSAGRKVFGGGGITPDVKIESLKQTNFTSQLVSKRIFFDFASYYVSKHPDLSTDFEYFKNNFLITAAIISDFKTFVKSKDIEINEQDFNTDLEYIKLLIKSDLARRLWDSKHFYLIRMPGDRQVQEALKLIPEAAKIAELSSSQ